MRGERKKYYVQDKNKFRGGGVLSVVVALFMIVAVFMAFTMPQAADAATPPKPKSVKVTAKVNGKWLDHSAKWSKPASKSGYKLKKYEYEWKGKKGGWGGTFKTSKKSTGTEKWQIKSMGKKAKVRVRAVYRYKGKTVRSGWAEASKTAK